MLSIVAEPLRQRIPRRRPNASAAVAANRPCDGCAIRQSCRAPCDEVEALLGPQRTGRRDVFSPFLVESRSAVTWEPSELEDSRKWKFIETQYGPRLHHAARNLKGKERTMIKEFLDGESEDRIARKLGLPRHRVEQVMAMATDKLAVALDSSGPAGPDRCAVPGCEFPVGSRRPSLPDLQPYCDLHRQMRAFAIADVEPDRAAAAALTQSGAYEAGYVDVTPQLAFALLQRNTNNRSLWRERVEMYARDMASGDWRPNNQGIAIGADGLLYDGQHRLWAILKSGSPVRLLVVRGLPAAARATIDAGRPRNVGETLRIVDGRANGTRIVSWLRAIEVMTAGRSASISHAVARRALEEFDPSVRWFLEHGPRAPPYSRGPIVGALVYAHAVQPDLTEAFTRRYVSGAQLDEGSPVLALRNYVAERMLRVGDSPRMISLKTLRCLLAEARSERLEHIPASEGAFLHFRDLHEPAIEQAA